MEILLLNVDLLILDVMLPHIFHFLPLELILQLPLLPLHLSPLLLSLLPFHHSSLFLFLPLPLPL